MLRTVKRPPVFPSDAEKKKPTISTVMDLPRKRKRRAARSRAAPRGSPRAPISS